MRYLFLSILVLFCVTASVQAQPGNVPQEILDDIGITQADVMQFGMNLSAKMEEYQQKFQDRFKEPPTSANYKEYVGKAIDEMGTPLADAINQEMKSFFTPDQYQKIQTRFFQFSFATLNAAETSDDPQVMGAALGSSMSTFLGPPDFLEFTDDQKKQLQQLQKETILELAGFVINLQEGRQKLQDQLNEATTDEERERITKQMSEEFEGGDGKFLPQVMPILMRAKKKYEKILTDKQRAKMQEVLDDIPDYLWAMMPQNQDKERAWKPGANSWKPGDGAPEGVDTDREARPVKPEGKKTFPGQSEE